MRYCFIALLVIAAACGGKKEEGDEWTEMEEFHVVMADVYHPLKDGGDLGPIKADAGKLAAAAEKWAKAPLPAKVDNENVKGYLATLQDRTKILADKIGTMTDDQIKEEMTSLHDIFHQAMEAWYAAAGEEHHDH